MGLTTCRLLLLRMMSRGESDLQGRVIDPHVANRMVMAFS
jgi:hypothetical protein